MLVDYLSRFLVAKESNEVGGERCCRMGEKTSVLEFPLRASPVELRRCVGRGTEAGLTLRSEYNSWRTAGLERTFFQQVVKSQDRTGETEASCINPETNETELIRPT